MADVINFDSANSYQKEFMSGDETMTITPGNSFVEVTINHDLGYRPNAEVWFQTASGYWTQASNGLDQNLFPVTSEFATRSLFYAVYDNTMTIRFDRTITTGTLTTEVHYRIYVDEAE